MHFLYHLYIFDDSAPLERKSVHYLLTTDDIRSLLEPHANNRILALAPSSPPTMNENQRN